MRQAMNAILLLVRTGCPWRSLPRGDFPPRSTGDTIFRKFQGDGTWAKIRDALYSALREHAGREAGPTAGALDSQTVKPAEKRGSKAKKSPPGAPGSVRYDAGKKTKGR